MSSKMSRIFILAAFATVAASANAITIAEARALAVGTAASVQNVKIVSMVDLISSGSSKSFQIQDASGAATVFGSNAVIDGLLAGLSDGSTMDLDGTTGTFNGLFQFVAPLAVSNTAAGAPVTPTTVVATDFLDDSPTAEGFESMLVALNNVSFTDVGTFAGNTNYLVTDGVNQVTVRISTNDLNMIGDAIPMGPVNLTGIFSQFDSSDPRTGGYQLLLRSRDDITAVPEPATLVGLGLAAAAMIRRRRNRA